MITRLALLKREGIVDIWHDNEILPGDKWRDTIFSNLADSDLLLYLTSAYKSENCNKELTAALNAEIRVIPIILERCDWGKHEISALQALPDRANPINTWQPENDGWQNVVEGIRRVVENMHSQTEGSSDTSEEELLAELAFLQGNFLIIQQIDRAIFDRFK